MSCSGNAILFWGLIDAELVSPARNRPLCPQRLRMRLRVYAHGMRLLRYDLPRQVLISLLAAMAVTAAIGWLISVLDQVTPEEIAKAEVRGEREGRLDGYEAAFERGRLDGAGRAQLALPELLASGDPADALRRSYEFSWNAAIDLALHTAKRNKLEVESAFESWEALRQ